MWTLRLGVALLAGLAAGAAATSPAPPPPPEADTSAHGVGARERAELEYQQRLIESHQAQMLAAQARRDSLQAKAQERLRKLTQQTDSLRDGSLNHALEDIGGVINQLGQELSRLELQVEDNTISLRDAAGGRVRVNVPADLGEKISTGLAEITAALLHEIPDTIRLDSSTRADGRHRVIQLPVWAPQPPAVKRRSIGGDMVRVGGDVTVEADEALAGDAVAVFGDVRVAGRVDGSVVAVFGNVQLDAGAEVTGDVVVVLGRLARHERVKIRGGTVALGPGMTGGLNWMRASLWSGWLALGLRAAALTVIALLLALLFLVLPQARLQAALGVLCRRSAACFLKGLVWLLLGHLVLALSMAVLILTLIGIPVALMLGLAYAVLILMAFGLACHRLGAWVRDALSLPLRHDVALALLGLVLLHLPGLFGSLLGLVPGMGGVAFLLGLLGLALKLAAVAFGLGALVVSRFGGLPALATPPPAPAAAGASGTTGS